MIGGGSDARLSLISGEARVVGVTLGGREIIEAEGRTILALVATSGERDGTHTGGGR